MLTLKDGPCRGTYLCHRAPVFLRAVINRNEKKDCLDLIEDTPAATEKVHVYERKGGVSQIHVKAVRRAASGFYSMALYHHLSDVDGETLRDNPTWQKWATERLAKRQEEEDVQKEGV